MVFTITLLSLFNLNTEAQSPSELLLLINKTTLTCVTNNDNVLYWNGVSKPDEEVQTKSVCEKHIAAELKETTECKNSFSYPFAPVTDSRWES